MQQRLKRKSSSNWSPSLSINSQERKIEKQSEMTNKRSNLVTEITGLEKRIHIYFVLHLPHYTD